MQHKHPCTDKITVIFIMVLFPLKYNTYSIIVILYPCCPALNTKFSNLYPNFNLNIPQLTSHHFPPHSSYCYFLLYSDTSIPFFWIMFVLWIVILPPATLNEFAIPLRLFFFLLRFFQNTFFSLYLFVHTPKTPSLTINQTFHGNKRAFQRKHPQTLPPPNNSNFPQTKSHRPSNRWLVSVYKNV